MDDAGLVAVLFFGVFVLTGTITFVVSRHHKVKADLAKLENGDYS